MVQMSSASFICRSFTAVFFLFTKTLSADTKLNSTASANSESGIMYGPDSEGIEG